MIDVVCGHGRLGSRVLQLLQNDGRQFVDARIDAQKGLRLLDGSVPAHISRLLICMVPKSADPASSAWQGLLAGLMAQVRGGELQIDQALYVSSTAVYEAQTSGWISAQTPVFPAGITIAASARSAGLIDAETSVRELSANTCVVRLAGITGPGYERYDPIVSSAAQTRHAIDVRSAARSISALLHSPVDGASTHLLTDSYVYFQGQKWPADPGDPELQALALQHKLLLPSLLPAL